MTTTEEIEAKISEEVKRETIKTSEPEITKQLKFLEMNLKKHSRNLINTKQFTKLKRQK